MAGLCPANPAALARDHYAVLGVYEPADCTPKDALERIQYASCLSMDELKKLYYQEALQRHPDKLASHPGAASTASTEAFQQLQNAWQCLQNPKTRKEYDDRILADVTLRYQQAKTAAIAKTIFDKRLPPEQKAAVPPEPTPAVPPEPMQAEPINASASSSDNPFVKHLKYAVRVQLPGSTPGLDRTFRHKDYMNPNVCSQVADAYFAEASTWLKHMQALSGTCAFEWMKEHGFAPSGSRAQRTDRTPAHAYIHLSGGMHNTCSIWNAFQNAFHTYEHMRLLPLLLLLSPHIFDLSTF